MFTIEIEVGREALKAYFYNLESPNFCYNLESARGVPIYVII